MFTERQARLRIQIRNSSTEGRLDDSAHAPAAHRRRPDHATKFCSDVGVLLASVSDMKFVSLVLTAKSFLYAGRRLSPPVDELQVVAHQNVEKLSLTARCPSLVSAVSVVLVKIDPSHLDLPTNLANAMIIQGRGCCPCRAGPVNALSRIITGASFHPPGRAPCQ